MDAKTELGDRLSSIRIVSVDSYMRAPILGLDPCYSEFRGNDIKQVPVLRIFGTDSAGIKTCMHVHGVFPYLYVPYDGSGSADDADRLSYQLAASLDKAINISLGQTNSSTQHIFKVVVVKGTPFYGYHRQEHQYLKIFLYNPAMVRRTANLLQNAAILNRVYQPHESHLPYVLQFMIDYNLYGMSFLYVPSTVIRYRQPHPVAADAATAADDSVASDFPLQSDPDGRQWLDKKIERMTTSANEIDVEATFILNRFQIALHENAEHANPGIAFIWSDERGRRSKMEGKVPPLQSGPEDSQDRKEMAVSESEAFHQTALDRKLDQIRLSGSPSTVDESFDTFNQGSAAAQVARRKFNLNQFLQNAVYPAECTPQIAKHSNRSMLNASSLIDHMRSSNESTQLRNSLLGTTSNVSANSTQRSSMDLDETLVDEELVLSLSQKPSQLDRTFMNDSFNQDEQNVLEILQRLEEVDEEQQINESCIEDDSILAPLSQAAERPASQRQSQIVNLTQKADATEQSSFNDNGEDLDSDDELLNDFSMSMLECMPQEITATQAVGLVKMPQLDGANDSDSGEHFVTSHKAKPKINRTPTRRDKYAPLNITITRSPGRKVDLNSNVFPLKTIPTFNLDHENDQETRAIFANGCARGPLNGTLSTTNMCEPSPSREQKEKEVPVTDMQSMCRPVSVKLVRCDDVDAESLLEEPMATPPRRYPKRNRGPPPMYKYEQSAAKTIRPRKTKPSESDYFDSWSNCIVAYRYDMEKNFFPEPGPSTINYYVGVDLPGYYTPLKSRKRTFSRTRKTTDASAGGSSSESEIARTPTPKTKKRGRKPKTAAKRLVNSPEPQSNATGDGWQQLKSNDTNADDEGDDIMMQSFYADSPSFLNNTFIDSPQPKSFESPLPPLRTQTNEPEDPLLLPAISKFMKCVSKAAPISPVSHDGTVSGNTLARLRATESAPSRIEVARALDANEFPQVVNRRPFYSNPKDINQSNRTEVGHTVLQLGGASINDCEPFASHLNIVGLNAWRKLTMSNVIFPINGKKQSAQQHSIELTRELLATDKRITIVPHELPPSTAETTKWLQKRNRLVQKKCVPVSIVNGNGNPEVEPETIVIDDDSEPEMVMVSNGHGGSDKTLSNGSSPSGLVNGYNQTQNQQTEQVEDVICLDDSDDDGKIGNHFKISIISSPSTGTVSLKDEIDKIAKEVGAQEAASDEPSTMIDSLNLEDTLSKTNTQNFSFGISEATLENSYGFKMDLENFQCAKANIEHNYLTILSLEIHVQTRPNFLPDPAIDPISCIFYAIHNNVPEPLPQNADGLLINTAGMRAFNAQFGIAVTATLVESERELLMSLVRLIRQWDPDIFAGYEIEMSSWGYVMQRSQAIGVDLVPLISRVPSQKVGKFRPKATDQHDDIEDDERAAEFETEFKLYGRILLDVWRLMRGEINLTSYSFENIMYHVRHIRYPLYTKAKLTQLWAQPLHRWIVVDYYAARAKGTLEILSHLDLIGRTCELAKLFGIQFYEVLSRGSQFRVESMMLRIAKPKNLIPMSPSVQQRAHMRSPEYLALIMEPHSRFYADPMIVLDFQSLYPSMIIAYNYCFSTCLGRVEHLGQDHPFEFGANQLRVPIEMLQKLNRQKLIHIAPCGAVFVKASVREGILPRMLREILEARLMVKQSMKVHKSDKLLQRVLHSRQLGLKLMANVTYGYTAANFSGRMPCVEVGDSVVSKGRETLERAIKTVESNPRWACKVVYGDTDSLFVLVPGRTRADAFRIGAEIAEVVTKENPHPVKLKLEKVYQPSILQTKKRYVGFMYENADQNEPVYEAKGIETVRRDGCPAVAKILEKTLRILFETCDVSAVKQYVCRQFTKILSGHANVQDLIFAKEFRGVHGYKPGACVPSLELTRTARLTDHRAEPRCGERVPYLVINGSPGLPLIRLVRSPHEYLNNEGLKINAMYYITKVIIPPLNRCLLLIGADAHQWFADLPRKNQYLLSLETASKVMTATSVDANQSTTTVGKKSTISQYFSTTNCVCDCGGHTQNGVCDECLRPERKRLSAVVLVDKCLQLERKLNLCMDICSSCCGQNKDTKCTSLDCSVLFMLNRWKRDAKQIDFYRQLLSAQF